MSVIGYKAQWTGTKCHITVEIELAETISNKAIEEVNKQVANAMVEELAKDPQFQEGIRKLAVKRILGLLED